jgi:hypothetical protein
MVVFRHFAKAPKNWEDKIIIKKHSYQQEIQGFEVSTG